MVPIIGVYRVDLQWNDVETQKYVYTDGVENEEVFANKTYTTVKEHPFQI